MKSYLLVILLTAISTISCHSISQNGINLIKRFEGCELEAYYDKDGKVWTIGYGTTNADKSLTKTDIKSGLKITQAQADEWLKLSVNQKYGANVDKFDNTYHWTQNEFDALCSFAYNVGSINGLVSNGNLPKADIPSVMLQYVYSNKVKLDGLVKRRQAEVNLYKSGSVETNGNTNTNTNTSKKWLPDINGYDKKDANNGYAGIAGKEVTGLKVSGGKAYRVHIKGGDWLPEVTGNNANDDNNGYAGTSQGSPIDAVAVSGNVKYAVHVKGEKWLPEVTGYNIKDDNNGYAGVLGKPIDAVMINGRTYATSYNGRALKEKISSTDTDTPAASTSNDSITHAASTSNDSIDTDDPFAEVNSHSLKTISQDKLYLNFIFGLVLSLLTLFF